MHFARCTVADLNEAVVQTNLKEGYDLVWSLTGRNGSSFRGRILPTSSYVKGARKAPSGRRVRAACWHAHRDVLAALFDAVPGAKVSTGATTGRKNAKGQLLPTTYDGRQSFLEQFPDTYDGYNPNVSYGSLCDCEE